MSPPSTPEAWKDVIAQGRIGRSEVQRLMEGQEIELGWLPLISIADVDLAAPVPASFSSPRYRFRLHWRENEGAWYIDGMGPELRGWLPVQGPLWGPPPNDPGMMMLKLGALLLAACSPEAGA